MENYKLCLKHFFLRYLFSIPLIVMLVACAGEKMSVEQAKQVTVSMSEEAFVPPPRRIDDILSILDQPGQFDKEITEKHRAIADALPPDTENAKTLYPFYLKRGQAAWQIFRHNQALEDLRKALHFSRLAKISDPFVLKYLGTIERYVGNYKRGIELLERSLALEKQCPVYSQLVKAYTMLGDLDTAERIKNVGVKFCDSPDSWGGEHSHADYEGNGFRG